MAEHKPVSIRINKRSGVFGPVRIEGGRFDEAGCQDARAGRLPAVAVGFVEDQQVFLRG